MIRSTNLSLPSQQQKTWLAPIGELHQYTTERVHVDAACSISTAAGNLLLLNLSSLLRATKNSDTASTRGVLL